MELYLQDNMIVALNGSLRHLTCLQVLLLNGNQLLKLTDVVHELKAMQFLKTLSECYQNSCFLLNYNHGQDLLRKPYKNRQKALVHYCSLVNATAVISCPPIQC